MPRSTRPRLLFLALLAAGFSAQPGVAGEPPPAPPAPPAAADATPLIPRRTLFGNPEKTNPRISHDGKRLSYLAPVDGTFLDRDDELEGGDASTIGPVRVRKGADDATRFVAGAFTSPVRLPERADPADDPRFKVM